MKLSDFILLTEREKKTIVLHGGILIAKRREDNNLIFLFQLDKFYVEVYCSLENKAVKEYRAFYQLALLNPYLESIHIDGLL